MGATDSKQKLGQKVQEARKKMEQESKTYSEKANIFNSKSSLMTDYMIQSISETFAQCAPFMEATLLTAWYSNPKQCENIILRTCKRVLNAPIKKEEWQWFQKYLFPSCIWFFKSTQNSDRYMYEQIIEIATTYSDNILKNMDSIYDSLQYQNGWKELNTISNKNIVSRQDGAKVGLLKEKALSDISESKSDDKYEMETFLDSTWCLNSLLSCATKINDEFQNHVATVLSHYGEFKPGPLKTIERCQSKMENDYANCEFPKSAKLLDIVRCSCTFNTVQQLVDGYNGLLRHIQKNNSMMEVARIKNGFLEAGNGKYRDLKVNVIYKSPVSGTKMICEVQLLLVNYLWEKRKIHKLYNVCRQEEYFKLVTQENTYETTAKDPKDLKLVPAFNFYETFRQNKDFYESFVDSESNLLGVRADGWFGCVSLSTNKIIFEKNNLQYASHNEHWIKVNGQKYITIQFDKNLIKMYKVDNNTFSEDKRLEIQLAEGNTINFTEFDRDYENIFMLVNWQILQQRSINDLNNAIMSVKLNDRIFSTATKQFCLSDNGEYCVVAGGAKKNWFYVIDLKKQVQRKYASNTLDGGAYAPCFINGETQYISIGDNAGNITIWDLEAKKAVKVIHGFTAWIGAQMSTNNILAAASKDKNIKLWDVRNWEMFYSDNFDVEPYSLHLTSDAKYLTIGGDLGARCLVWKIE